MTKPTNPHDREQIWKTAWEELRGFLLMRGGHAKHEKARATRQYIRQPMPNDIPRMIRLGTIVKSCRDTLVEMERIEESMWHGRRLAPHQDAKLQTEVDGEAKDEHGL